MMTKNSIFKILSWLDIHWTWLPCTVFLLGIVLCFLMTTYATWLETIVFIALLFAIILQPIIQVYMALHKEWRKLILSLLLGFLSILICIPIGFFAQLAPDGFGHEHPIPEGLEYNNPLGYVSENGDESDWIDDVRKKADVDSTDMSSYLQIWEDGCKGDYLYDFYYPALPKGMIYLKCFEVTDNLPLSKDQIYEKSAVHFDTTNEFSRIVHLQEFTLYEGDWDDYYAVRVEVWYRNDKTKEETKLLEKIYRMEGWMR